MVRFVYSRRAYLSIILFTVTFDPRGQKENREFLAG
jgi:hypothetical protein